MYKKPYPDHWYVEETEIICDDCGKKALKLGITCSCGDHWTIIKCKRCDEKYQ